MKSICRSWACLMVLSASGCAIYPEDAAHPMSEGWRVAHIDHTVSPDESTPLVRFAARCLWQPVKLNLPAGFCCTSGDRQKRSTASCLCLQACTFQKTARCM
jgi:hypothetical protein